MSERSVPAPIEPIEQPVPYDGNKRPAEIERDIARTRADLSETLDALERTLAPRQLLEKGVDMLRDSIDGNLGRVSETIRSNPVPLALIGAGIGWLLLSTTGGSSALGEAARSARRSIGESGVGQRATEVAGRVGELAGDAAERAKRMVGMGEPAYPVGESYAYARARVGSDSESRMAGYGSEIKNRAAGTARDVGQRVGDYARYAGVQAERARDRFTQLIEDHPLALGALSFMTGAAVAMMLPATRAEDEYLGDARDRVIEGAQEAGREALDRAQKAAGAAVEAAADAAADAIGKDGKDGETESEGLGHA